MKILKWFDGKKTYFVGLFVSVLGAAMFFKLAHHSIHSEAAFFIAGTVVLNGLAILTGRHAFTKIERMVKDDRYKL